MKRFIVCILAAVSVVSFSLLFAAGEKEVEKKEELASFVTVYEGSGSVEIAGHVAKFIQEKVGVEVRFTSESHGVIHSKIKAEAPNFTVDMVIGGGFPLMVEAKEKGWSVPYDSPNWRGAGDIWVDPDGYWWNYCKWSFVLVGNKDLFEQKGYKMPESWDDLLDPKWKGQIVMPSPLTSGTAYMMMYSFITLYGFNRNKGEEGGWEYIEALDKQIAMYTRGGSVPTDLVGRGEYLLGITSDEMVVPRIKEGYPLVWKVPREGTGYGSAGLIILKGTKKLYTCQKLIDFIGTTEFLTFWSNLAGYVTKDPDVKPALYGGIPNYIPNIDENWATENRKRISEEWKTRIGRAAK